MFSLRRMSILAVSLLVLLTPLQRSALAQEGENWQPFDPFADIERRKAQKSRAGPDTRPYLPTMNVRPSETDASRGSSPETADQGAPSAGGSANSPPTVMREALPPPVEKSDLAPIMASDGSNMPLELWQGMDLASFEKLVSQLPVPPRSPALHGLWTRLFSSKVAPPGGSNSSMKFQALKLEILYRTGLTSEAEAQISRLPANDPVLNALSARNALANGNSQRACDLARTSFDPKSEMPKQLKAEVILMSGYCAAQANDMAGAGLFGDLAREEGVDTSPGLDALEAISMSARPKVRQLKQISLIDYLLLEKAGLSLESEVATKGEPALLVLLAKDTAKPMPLRLAAAEAALRLNALSPQAVSQLYREAPAPSKVDSHLASEAGGPERRAALFNAAEAEQTPMKRTRIIRAFLDDAKKSQFLFQGMLMMAPVCEHIEPQPETSWFAETAVEVALAAGHFANARRWIALAGASEQSTNSGDSALAHWLALTDIADPNATGRGQDLPALEHVTGRFSPDMLHRLATVLDALNYNVPIPLWDAMSRTPQPNSGYLPETGVLPELLDTSKKKEFGHTVLLVMKALGPDGAEGAHMIALGDSIRALKRAGLEADARKLGLEALLAGWPRSLSN